MEGGLYSDKTINISLQSFITYKGEARKGEGVVNRDNTINTMSYPFITFQGRT